MNDHAIDLNQAMQKLSASRPVFHSEADFQHSLAWTLHEMYPAALIRLEVPFVSDAGTMYIDVVVRYAETTCAIELKYKTRQISVEIEEEAFNLQSHVALPLGRYDVLKDLQRVETYAEQAIHNVGAIVFLTNDSAYWSKPRSDSDTSAQFSLYNGREITGRLNWSESASAGTKKGREAPIKLSRRYCVNWKPYSTVASRSYAKFAYWVQTVDFT